MGNITIHIGALVKEMHFSSSLLESDKENIKNHVADVLLEAAQSAKINIESEALSPLEMEQRAQIEYLVQSGVKLLYGINDKYPTGVSFDKKRCTINLSAIQNIDQKTWDKYR